MVHAIEWYPVWDIFLLPLERFGGFAAVSKYSAPSQGVLLTIVVWLGLGLHTMPCHNLVITMCAS